MPKSRWQKEIIHTLFDEETKRGRSFVFIKIWRTIIKNYKLLIRTKVSALIFLLIL